MDAKRRIFPVLFLVAAFSFQPATGQEYAEPAPAVARWLQALRQHPSSEMRATAAYRLAPAGQRPEVAAALQWAMLRDPDPQVRQVCRRVLNRTGAPVVTPASATQTPHSPTSSARTQVFDQAAYSVWEAGGPHRKPEPLPLMDMSFRPNPALPDGVRPDQLVEPAGHTTAEVQPPATTATAVVTTPLPQPVTPASIIDAQPANVPNKTVEPAEPAKSESVSSEFSLYIIPRSVEGRRELAQRLLAEGRNALEEGDISTAEKVVYQLRELALEYGPFEDNPDQLQLEISRSRSFGDLLYREIKKL